MNVKAFNLKLFTCFLRARRSHAPPPLYLYATPAFRIRPILACPPNEHSLKTENDVCVCVCERGGAGVGRAFLRAFSRILAYSSRVAGPLRKRAFLSQIFE